MAFNIKTAKGIEEAEDTVGSGGALASNVYPMKLKNAYLHIADSGSQALATEIEVEGNRIIRPTFYVTTKEGNNYYETKDGKKKYLQGYLIADALAMLATEGEAGIGDLDTEQKTITVYDSEKGGEVNKKVDAFVDLIGLEFNGGLLKVVKPKSTKNTDGTYTESKTETVEINELDKVFNEDGFTTIELQNGDEEPEFINRWLARWEDKVKTVKPKADKGPAGRGAGARTAARTGASTGRSSGGAKKSFFKGK